MSSECNHCLGPLSSMVTTHVTVNYTKRTCRVCSFEETLRRTGRLWVGYNLKAEQFRDFERREYAKDLLQPKDKRGKIDELYSHAWGDPYMKSKIGTRTDEARVKE